jgi:mannose-6-phosphate isomerase-like protein (cupin superfamily)
MRLHGLVEKKWGHELIFATNNHYCGKILHFKVGSKFSMHFHAQKDETWYVLSGKFIVKYIDTVTATEYEKTLIIGDTWHNPALLPHQLICLETGDIIEVSTADSIEDNYRIAKGDSQC